MVTVPSLRPDRLLQQSTHGGLAQRKRPVKASLDGEATISHQPVIVLQVLTGAGFGEKRTVKPVAQHSRQRDERQLVDNHRQLLGRDQTDGAEQQQRGQQPAAEAGLLTGE